MEKMDKGQLAAMIIMFQIGSSPLFLLASEAKQDAWIAVSIAMMCGLLLICVTLSIQRQRPNQNLIEILQDAFGKITGSILSFGYIIYFVYKSVRNVREFGDLTILYLLPHTPISVITLILMGLSSYAIFKGIEVFFRTVHMLLPFVVLIYALLFILFAFDGLIHFEYLLPMLHEGLKPVIAAALPEVISFPFGEMILFLMFGKHLNEQAKLSKVTIISYLLSGFFLIWTNMMIVTILGPLGMIGGIPLLTAAGLVEIGNLIERMDPLIALLLFTGVLIKQTAYYLGAVLAVSSLMKQPYRYLIAPVGLLIYIGPFLFRSQMQQLWFGFERNVQYHFPIFQIVLPLLLWSILRWKAAHKKSGGDLN